MRAGRQPKSIIQTANDERGLPIRRLLLRGGDCPRSSLRGRERTGLRGTTSGLSVQSLECRGADRLPAQSCTQSLRKPEAAGPGSRGDRIAARSGSSFRTPPGRLQVETRSGPCQLLREDLRPIEDQAHRRRVSTARGCLHSPSPSWICRVNLRVTAERLPHPRRPHHPTRTLSRVGVSLPPRRSVVVGCSARSLLSEPRARPPLHRPVRARVGSVLPQFLGLGTERPGQLHRGQDVAASIPRPLGRGNSPRI